MSVIFSLTIDVYPILYFFHQCCSLDRSDNESVLAIQPAQQADQPDTNLKDSLRPKVTYGSLWWQISLIVLASLALISLVAAAPLSQYTKWRRGPSGQPSDENDDQTVFQRLVGN